MKMLALDLVMICIVTMQSVLAKIEVCTPVDTDLHRVCRLRQNLYDIRVWNHWAGFYCYNYTNIARLNIRYPNIVINVSCNGNDTFIPVAVINSTFYITYNYLNKIGSSYIKQSFKSDSVFKNYVKCCEEAEACCANKMNFHNILSTNTHCPTIWDGWSCFPQTPSSTTAQLPCSSQVYQNPEDVCTLYSQKQCLYNNSTDLADWNQYTDYVSCDITPVLRSRYNFHVVFLGLCIAFCLPAVTIFFLFEKLRETTRVILHRNLLVAICIRNCLTILSKKLIILDALKPVAVSNRRMAGNGIGCRILSFLETSSVNCIYACMFLDAYYLHKVIVRVFAKEPKVIHIYIVLIVMTFGSSLIWAISMSAVNAQDCWTVEVDNLQWIMDGFRIVILVINAAILADIIRVMLLKLKHGSTTKQTMAAFRATMLLIPLFGLHIIVTAKKIVYDSSCTAEDVYHYVRYTMEGLQGIVVSVLFCYANSEVRYVVKNGFRKTRLGTYWQHTYDDFVAKKRQRRRSVDINLTSATAIVTDNR